LGKKGAQATSLKVGQTVRSGSHRAKIQAENGVDHGIAKMAKLFQYCSLHTSTMVEQMNDSEMVRSGKSKAQRAVSTALFQSGFLSVNPDY
jgi:hypothetical protein